MLTGGKRCAAPTKSFEPPGSRGYRAPIGCTPKRDTSQPAGTKEQLKAVKHPSRLDQRANAESRRLIPSRGCLRASGLILNPGISLTPGRYPGPVHRLYRPWKGLGTGFNPSKSPGPQQDPVRYNGAEVAVRKSALSQFSCAADIQRLSDGRKRGLTRTAVCRDK
jgi:hypothetical protein